MSGITLFRLCSIPCRTLAVTVRRLLLIKFRNIGVTQEEKIKVLQIVNYQLWSIYSCG